MNSLIFISALLGQVDDWYIIPAYIEDGANYISEAKIANQIWEQAKIKWQFTKYHREDVKVNIRYTNNIPSGIGGFGGTHGSVRVKKSLSLDMRGEVLAHELGHVLGLHNVSNSKYLMGPGSTQRILSKTEIETVRSFARKVAIQ